MLNILYFVFLMPNQDTRTQNEQHISEQVDIEASVDEERTPSSEEVEEVKNDTPMQTTLLYNRDGFLPLVHTINLNIFGWASTNPYYGSGDSTLSFLQGVMDAGFEINTELPAFYRNYRAERPIIALESQDFTLPEPTQQEYLEELIPNAVAFSNVSVLFLARAEAEGVAVPEELKRMTVTEQELFDTLCTNFENIIVIYDGPAGFDFSLIQNRNQVAGIIWCPANEQASVGNLGAVLGGTVPTVEDVIEDGVYPSPQIENEQEKDKSVIVENEAIENEAENDVTEEQIPEEEEMLPNEENSNSIPIRVVIVIDAFLLLLIPVFARLVVYVGYIRRKKVAIREYAKEMMKQEREL